MSGVLYRGGRIHSPCDPHATAILVDGGTIGWLGADADAPPADAVVDLDGCLVTPAFVDAHVHLTETGLAGAGIDLSAVRSATGLLDAVAAAARSLPADAVVLAHGFDESTWDDPVPPDAAALDRAGQGRMVYAAQASLHSAVCSTALLSAATGEPGYHPSGWVRRAAHHAVRDRVFGAIGPVQRRAARAAALRSAAERGIAAVHECAGPGTSTEDEFAALLAGSGSGTPEVYGYWGELGRAAKARELGAVGAGGDLFVDGALGARTAYLRTPYRDSATGEPAAGEPAAGGSAGGAAAGDCGQAYLTAAQVRDHLLDCHDVGIAGGFHAIGDAAIATVLAGFGQAADRVGLEALRAARHRVEHLELTDRAMIASLVGYGVIASVQPAFDRLWGGERRMYARRLGPERALATNPFGAMHAVGVAMAFGSDSPVTPLDPWGTVRAAMCHHNPGSRLTDRAAFAAHTRGGWRAVGQDDHGALVPGAPATFAVWETPAGRVRTLPVLVAADPQARGPADPTPLPVCRRTVLRGTTLFAAGE